jgi:hypothetical protein
LDVVRAALLHIAEYINFDFLLALTFLAAAVLKSAEYEVRPDLFGV